jgi:outer membrane receptor protein involved in Fe transport
VPNPNLRPETNETQEYGFGLRFDDLMLASDALEFKASYFDTKAKDYISTTVDFAAATTMSYNVPNAKIWGWDVMAKYPPTCSASIWPITAHAAKIPTPASTSPALTRIPSPAS